MAHRTSTTSSSDSANGANEADHAKTPGGGTAIPLADRPLVVLVHGAWHGAWCWAELQAELNLRGLPSYALDLPGHGASTEPFGGLYDDARHVRRVLDALAAKASAPNQQIILVGHSYGGAVITQATLDDTESIPDGESPGIRGDIAHLVYIAAFALDAGESVSSALRSMAEAEDHPPAEEPRASSTPALESLLQLAVQAQDDGTTTLDPQVSKDLLYGSCDAPSAEAALRRLCPQPNATMSEAVQGSPRDVIPSSYIRCLRDRAVTAEQQSFMASRCEATLNLDTDHSPFMSTPGALAELLETIAIATGSTEFSR